MTNTTEADDPQGETMCPLEIKKLTAENYPNLHKAVLLLYADNGMLHRESGHVPPYPLDVPEEYISDIMGWSGRDLLKVSDEVLATLTQQELEDFCCGEHEDMKRLLNRSDNHIIAGEVLNQFFEMP